MVSISVTYRGIPELATTCELPWTPQCGIHSPCGRGSSSSKSYWGEPLVSRIVRLFESNFGTLKITILSNQDNEIREND